MSQNYNDDSARGTSTAEAPRPNDTHDQETSRLEHNINARLEAKLLLDEIAGVAPTRRRKPGANRGISLRKVILSPFSVILTLFQMILRPFTRLDFKLFQEVRKFLAHPGTFFWFNRLAPQAASRHFGTTSTDAMTHHLRRYAAHVAVLGLALTVVLGGGFSGVVRQMVSRDEALPGHSELGSNGYLTVTGNMKGIVLNSLGTSDSGVKRVKVYTVVAGDTLRDLAEKNNISIDTILYANQIEDPDYELNIGDKIVIPPVTGMWHVTTQNSQQIETIATIANKYAVDPRVIIDYAPNQLNGTGINTPLKPGSEVMVPNGKKPYRDTLIVYKVRAGETLDYIASKLGITKETIAIFNDDVIVNDKVEAGMDLTILPVSGIRVKVLQGDTVTSIAQRFGVPVDNITGLPMNNVTRDTKLKPGDYLVVPNGIVPDPPAPVTSSSSSGSSNSTSRPAVKGSETSRYVPPPPQPAVKKNPVSSGSSYISAPPPGVPVGTTGKMVWPMYGLITTYYGQSIWYGIHQGLDIAAAANTPVVAADGGTVIFAGWSTDGYGNMVMIAHSNGLFTLYGHFNQINVTYGQKVARGQRIGLEGSTGNSTGPHLHFEVRWGRVYGQTYNPLQFLK